jgi:extradiol dioxygenase family protein
MTKKNKVNLDKNIVRPAEGFHRALNTVKNFEEYTITFYTDVLGGTWNKNIRSSIAAIMPWATSLIANHDDAPAFADGPELALLSLHGIQFVCNLEENFSQEKQSEEKSYFGFILDSQEILAKCYLELKSKIKNFNDSVKNELFEKHLNFYPATISKIIFNNKAGSFYIEDMYQNKIEYKCSSIINKFPGVSCWPGLTSYKACINVSNEQANKIKIFYTEVMGALFIDEKADTLTFNLHGTEFQCHLDNHFEYLEHEVIEPAHFGFNIESIESFKLLHSSLEAKINKLNSTNAKDRPIHRAKIYPIATREISGFAHAAFFVRDMCSNFFEMKCFYLVDEKKACPS